MPQLKLPNDFFGYFDEENVWRLGLKPFDKLTAEQKEMVTSGPYRCLSVQPTQLYSSANAASLWLLLYLFWRRSQKAQQSNTGRFLTKSGSTFALMFILYGIARFFVEFLRDDNPFEDAWWIIYKGGTISQNLGIYMLLGGLLLMAVFQKLRPRRQSSG